MGGTNLQVAVIDFTQNNKMGLVNSNVSASSLVSSSNSGQVVFKSGTGDSSLSVPMDSNNPLFAAIVADTNTTGHILGRSL
ncbi:MAG: hypothetical protein RCG15_02865 [Candidatus Rickettsia vulgarisii]